MYDALDILHEAKITDHLGNFTSLDDCMKMEYFIKIWQKYSLSEIEKLIPE